MTRTVTPAVVKKIISKGLTGWEAGKLILQDVVDSYLYHVVFHTSYPLELLFITHQVVCCPLDSILSTELKYVVWFYTFTFNEATVRSKPASRGNI